LIPWKAQLELVRGLLGSPEACRELLGVLKAPHFEGGGALGHVAEAALTCFAEYKTLPTEGQVQEKLMGLPDRLRIPALQMIPDILDASVPPVGWVVSTGRHLAARAELLQLGTELRDLADTGEFTTVLDKAKAAARLASPAGEMTVGAGTTEDILARQASTGVTITTGFRSLDHTLGGGLKKGAMGHVLGKKGGGKSHVLVHIGAAALEAGLRVLHVPLEMSVRDTRARYDRRLVGTSGPAFIAALGDGPQVARLREAHERLTVIEAAKRRMTIHGIEAAIDRMPSPPDLVVIDYLQLITVGTDSKTDPTAARAAGLGVLSQDLHNLAQDRNLALWTAYQANRSGIMSAKSQGEPLDITAYAESIAAAWAASVVVSINQTGIEAGSRQGRLFVAENRDGPSLVTHPAIFDWRISKIIDPIAEEVSPL
jgi:RecA/RadA recombinase